MARTFAGQAIEHRKSALAKLIRAASSMGLPSTSISPATARHLSACLLKAAWHWRDGPEEAAMKTLLAAQLRYFHELERTGAKSCKDWRDLQELLKRPPSDETTAIDKARNWFMALLNKHPQYPPRPVEEIVQEAMEKWKLSKPKTREAYRDAQKRTGKDKWSVTRRPPKDILQDRAKRASKVPLI